MCSSLVGLAVPRPPLAATAQPYHSLGAKHAGNLFVVAVLLRWPLAPPAQQRRESCSGACRGAPLLPGNILHHHLCLFVLRLVHQTILQALKSIPTAARQQSLLSVGRWRTVEGAIRRVRGISPVRILNVWQIELRNSLHRETVGGIKV